MGGTGALSLGVNLLSREGNSQKWRMKDNKSHFWQVTFTWGLLVGEDSRTFRLLIHGFWNPPTKVTPGGLHGPPTNRFWVLTRHEPVSCGPEGQGARGE